MLTKWKLGFGDEGRLQAWKSLEKITEKLIFNFNFIIIFL